MKHVRTEIIVTVCTFVGEGLEDPEMLMTREPTASVSCGLKTITACDAETHSAELASAQLKALLASAALTLPQHISHVVTHQPHRN